MMDFIWFCASGDSYFLGASLMILAVVLTTLKARPCVTISAMALAGIGFLLVLMAAIPLPLAFYGLWAIAVVFLALPARTPSRTIFRKWIQATVVALSIVAILAELHFQIRPDLPKQVPLYIVGDSVSAEIQGPKEVTWPTLLAHQCNIDVVNLAQAGATVHSARKQATQIGDKTGLVLLEIGGNDLFAPTPLGQFESDLTDLLRRVAHRDRTVVMLELPVLPWQVAYTRIQRKLARKFDIALIPRRFFVAVLQEPGATLDLAHLSAKGHQKMADQMAYVLGYAKKIPHSHKN